MQPTLVVLAAGSGTRYGGLKQLDPVGPEGETLLECAVRDANRAGFGHFVLVIRRTHANQFKQAVLPRLNDVDVQLAYQSPDPDFRTRPWGTGHAVLCAREKVTTPFAVVNGDDWYGPLSYKLMNTFLCERAAPGHHAMIGFRLGNTLSPNGAVSRGICSVDEQGRLVSVTERTALELQGEQVMDISEPDGHAYTPDTVVSMNFWGFHPAIYDHLQASFEQFKDSDHVETDAEFYLPTFVDGLMQDSRASVEVLISDEQWQGITYKADRQRVAEVLRTDAVVRQFLPDAIHFDIEPLTGGLVHRTQYVKTETDSFVLQHFNTAVFKKPITVKDNYLVIREHLINSNYPLLIPEFLGGENPYISLAGNEQTLWRMSRFILGTECHSIAPSLDYVEAAGRAYGLFIKHLRGLDPTRLTATIPDFHNPDSRWQKFQQALETADDERKEIASCAVIALQHHQATIDNNFTSLPVRVTHNDCKLSNLLFATGEPTVRAVIDWDTVMPGYVITDFGDMVRSLCTTASEEERDSTKVDFNVAAYQQLKQGFLSVTQGWLTEEERQRLPNGAAYIVLEQAMRFLTDYLAGDVYYHADYAKHNLDRAANQLMLLTRIRLSLDI